MDMDRGMFSNKPVTDIESFVQLGDGKVVTGCEWGNLLLWEAGSVKVEIKRRDLSNCHKGPVQQFVMAEGELITIGCDGWIRVWDLESIEQAAPIDLESDEGFYLLDPMNEIHVSPDAILRSITRSKEPMGPDENFWFLQDAGGGIWKVDLSFSLTMKKPQKIRQCHAGAVTCLTASPISGLVVSGGTDGRICVYDLERKMMIKSVKYGSGVSYMTWIPLDMDWSGTQVLIGFADGVLRVYYIESAITPGSSLMKLMKSLSVKMKLLQAIKPHRTSIKAMDLDKKHKILATASLDKCVYIYRAHSKQGIFQMSPIGYFQMEDNIVNVGFKKDKDNITLLIALDSQEIVILNLNDLPDVTTENLIMSLDDFPKSRIDLKSHLSLDDNMDIINASFHLDAESPNNVLVIFSNTSATLIAELTLSNDKSPEVEGAVINTLPPPPKQSKISVLRYWLSGHFLLIGYENGTFRVVDIRDFSNLSSWTQGLNDPSNGVMTDIMHFKEYIISSGADGTLFTQKLSQKILQIANSHTVKSAGSEEEFEWKKLSGKAGFKAKEMNTANFDNVHDIENPNHLCLEDMKLNEAEQKTNKIMEDKMLKIQKDVSNLKRDFKKIQLRNEALNREYQVPREKFQMTDFTYKMIHEDIENKLKEVVKSRAADTEESKQVLESIRKRYFDPIAYNRVVVKGLKSKQELTTFRIAKMKENTQPVQSFDQEDKEEDGVKTELLLKEGGDKDAPTKDKKQARSVEKKDSVKADSSSVTGSVSSSRQKAEVKIMNEQVAKALAKQEAKREKKLLRKKAWDELHYKKPKDGEEDPTLIEEIKQAKRNLGDFKRKVQTDFESHETIKPREKADTLNNLLKKIFEKKSEFNEKVLLVKDEKTEVLAKLDKLSQNLVDIQYLLEPADRKTVPTIPMLDIDEHVVDPFEIDPKLVENMKEKLYQEADDMVADKSGRSGSRRSSRAGSVSSRKSRQRMSRQMSASSRQSSVGGTTPSRVVDKKSKHTEGGLFARLGPGQGTVAEDESDEAVEARVIEKSVKEANIDGQKSMKAQHEQDIKISEMQTLMTDFDDKIFKMVCEKNQLEAALKFAEISTVLLYEEFQIVNQDQTLEANLKAEVLKQETDLEKLNTKIADVDMQLVIKQKNVENLKDQKKSIHEIVERELSDNKHAEYLWGLYNQKPTSQKKQDSYEHFGINVSPSLTGYQQALGDVTDDEDLKGRPSDLNNETFRLIADFRNKRFQIEATLNAENRMEENINRELSNLKRNQEDQTKSLNKARHDLQSFKYSKQCKLNNLDAVLMVTKEQLQSLDSDRLAGMSDASDPILAFPEKVLLKLHNRTEELKQEKNATKIKYKEARTVFENLQLECKKLKKDIQTLDVKCGVEMQKRFGAGVSLETLEGFAVNRTLEEMKEASRAKEKHFWKLQNKRDQEIKDIKYCLHGYVLKNTEFIKRRTKAILDKQAIKVERQKTLKLSEKNRKKATQDEEDQKELKEMLEIFQMQGEEIMQLKSVLVRYVMKGIPVDPKTGKRNLRSRPSISEITRPKSARIKLKSSPGSARGPAYIPPDAMMMESVERIDKRPATAVSRTIVELNL